MGFMEKFKEWAKVEEDDEEEFEEFVPETPRAKKSASAISSKRDDRVVNIHTTTQLQVVLVKPEIYENATEIADHLKEKRTVVLNLESTNKDAARRILDFLSGVAYTNDGQIKRVANNTYIITPYNVDLKGDLIDELESSGLCF